MGASAPPLPIRELGFTQVAFAGHNRSEDLGDPAEAAAGLKSAFAMLSQAGVKQARMVSGLARGADLLAAEAWRAAGLGPIHAVIPFLDEVVDPAAAALAQSSTWLDGRTTESLGRNPHLAQTRWLIGVADLLVVVWTGDHARGAGGTADAVRLALEHGIPVFWIQPGEPCALRLIRPEHLAEDFGFLEFLEELRLGREPLVRAATPENLHEALVDLGLGASPPDLGDEQQELPTPAKRPQAKIWRTYAIFRRVLGGKAPPFTPHFPPADLMAQPGFAWLSRIQAIADDEASRLGAVHRSHQVILLGVAMLGAFAGSASSLWPATKLLMVVIEIFLALGAFAVWLDSEHGHRHERWGEARRLAEDLRLERVAWALGVSTAPQGVRLSSSVRARHVRRQAGLPGGMYDPDRVKAWGAWAIEELVAGQGAYHRAQAQINGRIGHRVHQVENGSFVILMIVLVSFVIASVVLPFQHLHKPSWLDGLVAVAGTIVPAIGAAALALEATLSLEEQAQRSRLLATRLELILVDLGSATSLEAHQAAAKAAIRLQRAQEDHWTEGAGRRRLYRAG